MKHVFPSELIVGRIAESGDLPKTAKAIEKRLRKRFKRDEWEGGIPRDQVFVFLAHRPFWNGEWEIPSYMHARFELLRPWDKVALEEFCDLYRRYDSLRRAVVVLWRSEHGDEIGRLHITEQSSSRESLKRQEDRSLWAHNVSFHHQRKPSQTAGEDAGREMRTFAEALGAADFIVPGDPPNRWRIEGMLPNYELRPRSQTYARLPFPYYITLDQLDGPAEAIDRLHQCLEPLIALKGEPAGAMFLLLAATEALPRAVSACREISPVWDWEFHGDYRKKFDPYTEDGATEEIRVYPVLKVVTCEGRLSLSAAVVHSPEGSFLELQTVEGGDWLRQLADAAGERLELWDGPLVGRWGLYSLARRQ